MNIIKRNKQFIEILFTLKTGVLIVERLYLKYVLKNANGVNKVGK